MKTKIKHIGLYVNDLEKGKAFYTSYFNGISNERYENKDGFQSYFIDFGTEVTLEIMTHNNLEVREVLDRVNGFSHIAFSVGSEENVISLTNTLRADRYQVYSEPRTTGDGYFESCVADPEGNRVEITI